ncbi:MAG: Cof-type HAD-IIB family hydrolase [Veillonellales bacterium]
MSIRLVAVDLDDTLLDNNTAVSLRTRQAIQTAIEQGVTVTVATGRMYPSALPYARQLKLDVPIITYNGAMITACLSEKRLYYRPLDYAVACQVLELFRERGWYIQSYVNDVLYVREKNDRTRRYEKAAGVTAREIGDKLYRPPVAPTKMLVIAEPERLDEIRETVKSMFGERLYVANSKSIYLEIAHSTVNKGRALAFLTDQLHINRQEVMAVGDSINDLDMIEYAGWGVAMGNGADAVKEAAQAVTLRNDEDGVAAAIEKYVLR